MRILKSPVFYFGLVLLTLVVLAVIAPYVVDWGRYRTDLEGWGHRLTGRDVAIRGPIEVKLFPFPQLTADNVIIANADGFHEPVFANIERVTVNVTLSGLINGELQVEALELQAPSFNVERNLENQLNTVFAGGLGLSDSTLLEHVQLNRINITGGDVHVRDALKGVEFGITDINTSLGAETLRGPWRLNGDMRLGPQLLNVTATSSAWRSGEAVKLSLRVQPADQSGYTLVFDGEGTDTRLVEGRLKLRPAGSPEEKSSSEGALRPLQVEAHVKVDLDELRLTEIAIHPAQSTAAATPISGSASLQLGKRLKGSVQLRVQRLDLNQYAGAPLRTIVREGGYLTLINDLLLGLPANLDLAAQLDADSLSLDQTEIENASLDIVADHQQVQIQKMSAGLPGRSRLSFAGTFLPSQRFFELHGKAAVESADLRQFTLWLKPAWLPAIEAYWVGRRGHLKAEAQVDLGSGNTRFTHVEAILDEQQATGSVSLQQGSDRPAIAVEFNAGSLEADALLRKSGQPPPKSDLQWPEVLQALLRLHDEADLRLKGELKSLSLNGVEAQRITLDIETTQRGLAVKTFDIGDVEGSHIAATGVILNTDAGADGDISLKLSAEDPRGGLRLFGLLHSGLAPDWAAALGATDLTLGLQARAGEQPGSFGVTVKGRTGALTLDTEGRLSLSPQPSFQGQVQLASGTSAPLWQLLGLKEAQVPGGASQLTLDLKPDAKGGTDVLAGLSIYGLGAQFTGSFTHAPDPERFGDLQAQAQGTVSVTAADITPLLQALGWPNGMAGQVPLSLSSPLQIRGNSWDVTALSGQFAGAALGGHVNFSQGASVDDAPVLGGELRVGAATLRQLAIAATQPWIGALEDWQRGFVDLAKPQVQGALALHTDQLEVYSGLTLQAAEVKLGAKPGQRTMNVVGATAGGQHASAELTLQQTVGNPGLSGHLQLPVSLATAFHTTAGASPLAGQAVLDVSFKGHGRSPAAIAADLSGAGNLTLSSLVIADSGPQEFATALASVQDRAGLEAAFNKLETGGPLNLPPAQTAVAISQGVLTTAPVTIGSEAAQITLNTNFDISQWLAEISFKFNLNKFPKLPAFDIRFTGQPNALQRQQDASALASALGLQLLNEDFERLDKVKAEQERLEKIEDQAKLADSKRFEMHTAQRAELRQRLFEQRVFADTRTARARAVQAITQAELQMRLRELSVHGQPH